MSSATVYTSVKTDKIQNPEFVKRNIKGETTADLGKLLLYGVPVKKEVAFDMYKENLPAFLKATAEGHKLLVQPNGHYAYRLGIEHYLPFRLPPLYTYPIKKTKDEDKSLLLSRIPGQISEGRVGTLQVIIIEGLTPQTFSKIPFDMLSVTCPTPVDATNIKGMQSLLHVVKIISTFMALHSYPAYQRPGEDEPTAEILQAQTSVIFKGYGETSKWMRGQESNYASMKVAEEDEFVELTSNLPEEDEAFAEDSSVCLHSAEDMVYVAKPAPLYPAVNYGTSANVPAYPGYLLPYFNGLITGTRETITSIMHRYFFRTFGVSHETNVANWKAWVQWLNSWYKTDVGKQIGHILFSIQLALQSQARLFLIFNTGRYHGSTLLGYQFLLVKEHDALLAAPHSELIAAARDVDKHQSALVNICDLLSLWTIKGDGMGASEVLPVGVVTGYRRLFREINRREKGDDESVAKLRAWVAELSFTESYSPITTVAVVEMLDQISNKALKSTIDDRTAFYLHPDLIFDLSIEHLALAIFGPTAPSFVDSRGSTFEIPKGVEAADPQSEIDPATSKKRMGDILTSIKPLRVAVTDMRGVMKRRAIRMNLVERAKGSRTCQFSGTSRDEIWNALKRLPFDEPVPTQKRKRSSEDDNDDEERLKKREARQAASSEAFSLDFM